MRAIQKLARFEQHYREWLRKPKSSFNPSSPPNPEHYALTSENEKFAVQLVIDRLRREIAKTNPNPTTEGTT